MHLKYLIVTVLLFLCRVKLCLLLIPFEEVLYVSELNIIRDYSAGNGDILHILAPLRLECYLIFV